MPPNDQSEARLRAQIAAHERWAHTPDRTSATAPGRAAFEQKFLDMAGGDRARAENLRKAHYLRLALKSAQARRRAKTTKMAALKAELDAAAEGGEA